MTALDRSDLPPSHGWRRAAVAGLAAVGLLGLAACGDAAHHHAARAPAVATAATPR